MRGKIIVIEGTDCSGKETQTSLLVQRLKREGKKVERLRFPMYETPTGKIVGGPYLGKDYITPCWFSEGAVNVDPKVAALYYAADRKYNIWVILEDLKNGYNVVLDRYVYSNMAHQGGKFKTEKERDEMFNWIEKLEFDLLELPHADIKVFLHMPYEASIKLKESRVKSEKLDQHERSKEHLIHAERAYLELAKKSNFYKIECAKDDEVLPIEKISEELYEYVLGELKK